MDEQISLEDIEDAISQGNDHLRELRLEVVRCQEKVVLCLDNLEILMSLRLSMCGGRL